MTTGTERIHSLRGDLYKAIFTDLIETGEAHVYGPGSTRVKVWNAVERAGRDAGLNVHIVPEPHGWWVAVAP